MRCCAIPKPAIEGAGGSWAPTYPMSAASLPWERLTAELLALEDVLWIACPHSQTPELHRVRRSHGLKIRPVLPVVLGHEACELRGTDVEL